MTPRTVRISYRVRIRLSAGLMLAGGLALSACATDRAAAPEKAIYQFNWLSATGTGIFLAGLFGAAWLRIGWGATLRQIAATGYRVRWALCTILCMLALAFTTKYSGADATYTRVRIVDADEHDLYAEFAADV